MIAIQKDYSTIPEGLSGDDHSALLKKAVIERYAHEVKDLYKIKSIESLKLLYYNKCAYCETDGSAGYYPEVEHYRPKDAKAYHGHRGYYWLAYEWSNLILCCRKCNLKKSSYFPIDGNRVEHPILDIEGLPSKDYLHIQSSVFEDEKALIINPETTDPLDHIIVLPNGKLKGISPQGIETIEKCGLQRIELVLKRRKKIKNYFKKFKKYFAEFQNGNYLEEELIRNIERHLKYLFAQKSKPEKQFRMVWVYLCLKFDIFAKSYLKGEELEDMLKYYREFLNNRNTNR